MFLVESSGDLPVCPCCKGELKYRDSKLRIRKKEGGVKEQLYIRRLCCVSCEVLHNELPDCLVPYKHYEAEVISGVLDEVVTPNDTDAEDYPCVQTMLRWLQWLTLNLTAIEGYLKNVGYSVLDLGTDFLFSTESLLETMRSVHKNWLEKVLRIIYNSGGFLRALPC